MKQAKTNTKREDISTMKNTNKIPTATALERAKTAAIREAREAANIPALKTAAKEAAAKAAKAREEAEKATEAWRIAKATAEAATAEAATVEALEFGTLDEQTEALEALTDEAREAYTTAKEAREAARKAEEAEEKAAAALEAATVDVEHLKSGREICVIYRMKTSEDRAAEEARKALAKAEKEKRSPDIIEAAREAAKEATKAAKAAAPTAARASLFIGLTPDPRRPSQTLAAAHRLADLIADKLGRAEDIAKTSTVWNIAPDPEAVEAREAARRATREAREAYKALIADPEADPAEVEAARVAWDNAAAAALALAERVDIAEAVTLAAARTVGKRTTANAVQRQGTPTHWTMYFNAAAAEWDAPDLANIVSEAAAALGILNAPAEYIARARLAAVLYRNVAARLRRISRADTIARAALMRKARAASRRYSLDGEDPRIVEDPDVMKSRADALALALEARDALEAGKTAEALEKINRAAYRAVNNCLSDLRTIRAEATAPALDIDALAETLADPRSIDPDAISEYEARRRKIIRAALPEAREALTPAQMQVLRALYKTGGNVREAARICDRTHPTILEHRAAVIRVIRAAIAKAAPNSIEHTALNLAAYVADLEAAEATADLAARKAREAAKETKDRAAEALAKAAARADLVEVIAAAVTAAVEELPDEMKKTADLLGHGTSKKEAAQILGKNRKTVQEAAKAAAARIADAITTAAPDIEIDPAIIAAADLAALFAIAMFI